MKKKQLRNLGCVLMSASVILSGVFCFDGGKVRAEYSGGNYLVDGGTITSGTLKEHRSELSYISSTGNLMIEGSALQEYDALENIIVTGTLSLGSYSLAGNGALNSVVCTTMSGADATTFAGCPGININITGQTAGSGYYMSGGALYNGSTLIYVPASAGESLTVRSGTTAIAAGAFNDSIITALYFQNRDADRITSFGTQYGWPSDEMICYCYGGSTAESASAVSTFFTRDCENAGANKVQYDSGTVGSAPPTVGEAMRAFNVSIEAASTSKYAITEGGSQVVNQNVGPIRIVCNGPVDKFVGILMDGQVVSATNYNIQSGSVIITFNEEYVQNLEAGDHVVRFQYDDGYSETALSITPPAKSSPKTGEF